MGRKRNPSKKKKKAAEKGTAGNWCECPHATSVAKSLDKSLVPGSLNPGAIDLKQTKKNVGRKGAGSRGVDEDLVLIYSLAMERGDIFPKIVVYKYPDGRLVVVAGVHRLLAVLLIGYTNIPVYFVSVHTAEEQLMFADGTNLEHGLCIGLQERIERATQLVVHGLKSKDEAAAWYGIETDPITLKLRVPLYDYATTHRGRPGLGRGVAPQGGHRQAAERGVIPDRSADRLSASRAPQPAESAAGAS